MMEDQQPPDKKVVKDLIIRSSSGRPSLKVGFPTRRLGLPEEDLTSGFVLHACAPKGDAREGKAAPK